MRRRDFIIVIAGSATFLSLAAHAQQQMQMRRIGVLESAGIETDQQAGVAVFISWVGSKAATCGSKLDGLALIPRRLAKAQNN